MKHLKLFEYNSGKFKQTWEADHYSWKKQENKDFWNKLTGLFLQIEKDSNPNGYLSELSDEKQSILVEVANQMILSDE